MRLILKPRGKAFEKGNKLSIGIKNGKGTPKIKKIIEKAQIMESLNPGGLYFSEEEIAITKKQLLGLSANGNEMAIKTIVDVILKTSKNKVSVKIDKSKLTTLTGISEVMTDALCQMASGIIYAEDMEKIGSACEKLFKMRKEEKFDSLDRRADGMGETIGIIERAHGQV